MLVKEIRSLGINIELEQRLTSPSDAGSADGDAVGKICSSLFKQVTARRRVSMRSRSGSHLPGEDPFLVVRRSEEAGDHQLPYLQAGARRSVLRQDLRAGEGLRVPVRQVQAPEASRRHLRKVRRRSDAVQGAPRAHGPHRTGPPGRAHLVPEVAAVAYRHGARHDAARHRTRPVLRSLSS